MIDFTLMVEQYAAMNEDMQHNPSAGNQRFFLCDGFAGMADMMRSIEPELSPCIQMESNEEGQLNLERNLDYQQYVIYFCTRNTDPGDGHEAKVAKKEAKKQAVKFMRWLKKEVKRLDSPRVPFKVEFDRVGYTTIGPLWDGWVCVKLDIEVGTNAECMEV